MIHSWYMKYRLSAKNVAWLHVAEPEPQELIDFVRDAQLIPVDTELIVRDYRRPEVAVRSDYLVVVIIVPVFNKKLRVTTGVAVYFIIREGSVFSLHIEPLPAFDRIRRDLERQPEQEEEYFEDNSSSFTLYVIDRLYASAFRKLERLSKHVDIAEDAIFQGNERKMVEEISILTRDVMDFRKIVRPQKEIFRTEPTHALVTPATHAQWKRVHGQLQRLWELLESLFESVQELSRTNYILIQYKEGELVHLLTFYSIIAIPVLLLVDPYYSPRAADASIVDRVVFWSVFGSLVLVLLFIVARAKRKRIL